MLVTNSETTIVCWKRHIMGCFQVVLTQKEVREENKILKESRDL